MKSPFALAFLKDGIDADEAERLVDELTDARIAEICAGIEFDFTSFQAAYLTGDPRIEPADPGWIETRGQAVRNWCGEGARGLIQRSREELLRDGIDRRRAFGRLMVIASGQVAAFLEILVEAGVLDPVPEGVP